MASTTPLLPVISVASTPIQPQICHVKMTVYTRVSYLFCLLLVWIRISLPVSIPINLCVDNSFSGCRPSVYRHIRHSCAGRVFSITESVSMGIILLKTFICILNGVELFPRDKFETVTKLG